MLLREGWYVPVSLARQYGSTERLHDLQLRGLNAMLEHSRKTVPHYRDDDRYDIGPLRSLDEVAQLPIVSKQELREHGDEFVSEAVDQSGCHEFFTSGTTGQRTRILHDAPSHDYHMAACMRRFTATRSYRPHYRLSHLRHFVPPKRIMERFGLFRRHVLLTTTPIEDLVEPLLANRPRVIIGYPVHLRELLRVLTPDQLAVLRPKLRFLMTESELLHPEHRRTLEQGFGVPVFDEYSSWETLNIYFECQHGRAHLGEDRVYVEIVDDDGNPVPDGTEGQVVVTHFRARAMPLIRYAVGDLGVLEPRKCPCGRRFRTMRVTRGRVNDRVLLADGRAIYSDTFLEIAETFPGIAECFVRQDEAGTVRVHVVPDGSEPMDRIADALTVRLDTIAPGIPLEIVAADRVPITAGGKGKFVESLYRADAARAEPA